MGGVQWCPGADLVRVAHVASVQGLKNNGDILGTVNVTTSVAVQ